MENNKVETNWIAAQYFRELTALVWRQKLAVEMKLLFSSPSSPEVGLLKGILDEAGITCEIRNQEIYPNFPGAAFQPEIWVIEETKFREACEVRDAWLESRKNESGSSSSQTIQRNGIDCLFSALTGVLSLGFTGYFAVRLAQTGNSTFFRGMALSGILGILLVGIAIALWLGRKKTGN